MINDHFHLEINSFDEFVQFVAIIRGEDLDPKKIEELRAKLASERAKLSDAIKGEKDA